MKVIWTAKAERQLDHIFQYIASDSELYAYRLVNKIINRAESLSQFPEKGQQVPEYQRKDIRQVYCQTLPCCLFISRSDRKNT